MLSKKISIEDIADQIAGKRVLMRVDFNVPVKEGKVKDVTRIKSTIPTINFALEHGALAVILMSHLGRPNGQKEEKSSLRPVAAKLEELLGKKVHFLEECVGEEVVKACNEITEKGTIILLENLRFHLEEELSVTGDDGVKHKAKEEDIKNFRSQLSKLGDIFINDAFGTAHRAHSSMVGVDLPIKAAGLLMEKEIKSFAKCLESPERPFLVIMGGAKVKDKIQLIMHMLEIVDEMIIAGGLAFTFLNVIQGMKIGNSIFDKEGAGIVNDILKKAEEKKVKLHFPIDFVCGDKKEETANVKVFNVTEGIEDGWSGFDVGPASNDVFYKQIANAKTVLWNGPPGLFEISHFQKGTVNMINAIAEASKIGAVTILGGGETITAVKLVPEAEKVISHISTGGGASLELLEGKQLPGIVYLSEK